MSAAHSVLPTLASDAHKGDAGRAFCVVGSRTMPGAAILVARAAQRAGAGLVRIGALDRALLACVPPAVPEAVYSDLSRENVASAFASGSASFDEDEALADALVAASGDAHALLVGPGLGRGRGAAQVARGVLVLQSGRPRVLDADALAAFEAEPELLQACAGPLVVTPHAGEAERLFGRPVPRDAEGREAYALEASERTGGVVVLKGEGTVIAYGGNARVNATGNAGMATAGAGDVLAGVLVAYLAAASAASRATGARPVSHELAFELAALAVEVHGRAGDLAAEHRGRRAVIASDLVEHLADAQRERLGE